MESRKSKETFFKERIVASRQNDEASINEFKAKEDASIREDYRISRKFILSELEGNVEKIQKILKSRYASELDSKQTRFLKKLERNTRKAFNNMMIMDLPYVQSLPLFLPQYTEKSIIRTAETRFPLALQKILERIEQEEEKSREKTGPRI